MAAIVCPDAPQSTNGTARSARTITVDGIVQGVGFRPFVWRLATELGLAGRVWNEAGRVVIEASGEADGLDALVERLRTDAPPRARVDRVEWLVLGGDQRAFPTPFAIDDSVAGDAVERLFPPDIATCDECLQELFDPGDRRYRYPFINCTSCGPRATIIDALPYDRARTTMRAFPLCPACDAEYRDPSNRRFHAEPVACPECGPRLSWRPTDAPATTVTEEAALQAATDALLEGSIVAVKGLGGYHLACDATDGAAVARLRDRKRRWAKPFAIMVRDLPAARALCRAGRLEQDLLTSPARPIVLLEARPTAHDVIDPGVAAGNRRLGVMLPYTPLHHLLLDAVGRPIVLTSGNLSDEPLATDDHDARTRLAGLADGFLAHDREIRARYDDTVTRVIARRESVVRRGRGYAPDPLALPVATSRPLLAVGAELKHTFTLARGSRAHVAPHNGDLEDLPTHRAFTDGLAHLSRLLAIEPEIAVHDLHPEYLSTKYAVERFPVDRRIAVQHHHAHVASCAAEHGLTGPFLGVAYDGLGMGDDGTLWGGEILMATLVGYRRLARFGRAPLPGGALAVRRPYRMALGYLLGAETFAGDADNASRGSADLEARAARFVDRLEPREVTLIRQQVDRRINAPVASSAGRLFDAVASLLGIRDVAEYEAQAAIDLELAAGDRRASPLPYRIQLRDGLLVYDPRPTLAAMLDATGRAGEDTPGRTGGDTTGGTSRSGRSSTRCWQPRSTRRSWTVTEELLEAARRTTGLRAVCLSGGVFQNRRLAARLLRQLAQDGFEPFINRQVPVNDGGVSYGQAAIAAASGWRAEQCVWASRAG